MVSAAATLDGKRLRSPHLFSVIFVLATAAWATRAQSADRPDFISRICNHTIHFEVCNTSLHSVPESRTADVYNLTRIAINLTIAEGLKIGFNISYMLDARFLPSYGEKSLRDCAELYSDALESLRLASKDLALGSFFDVNLHVTAAMTESSTCEDGFEELEGYTSPLAHQNSYFFMLCSNVLAINALLS